MRYESTALPDVMSVDGIYSVLRVDFSKPGVGIGEAHDFPELSFVSRGKHYAVINGVERETVAGNLSIIAPGSFHKCARPSDSELLIISFASDSPALRDLYDRSFLISPSQELTLRKIVDDGLKLFCRRAPGSDVSGMILKDGADERALYKMKKELELFLIDIHRSFADSADTPDSSQLRREEDFMRVCKFLEEHIGDSLSVYDIASGTNMSVSKLKILFREKGTGGVINHFTNMKIERAKRLILDADMNFTEIALSLGYDSLHYFSRLFKKQTGESPSKYKKR